jgi:hypothetical protein
MSEQEVPGNSKRERERERECKWTNKGEEYKRKLCWPHGNNVNKEHVPEGSLTQITELVSE